MPDHFAKLAEARMATGRAVSDLALSSRALQRVRDDRRALPEDISEAAQTFRKAEADLQSAVNNEIAAVLAAEEGG